MLTPLLFLLSWTLIEKLQKITSRTLLKTLVFWGNYCKLQPSDPNNGTHTTDGSLHKMFKFRDPLHQGYRKPNSE